MRSFASGKPTRSPRVSIVDVVMAYNKLACSKNGIFPEILLCKNAVTGELAYSWSPQNARGFEFGEGGRESRLPCKRRRLALRRKPVCRTLHERYQNLHTTSTPASTSKTTAFVSIPTLKSSTPSPISNFTSGLHQQHHDSPRPSSHK